MKHHEHCECRHCEAERRENERLMRALRRKARTISRHAARIAKREIAR